MIIYNIWFEELKMRNSLDSSNIPMRVFCKSSLRPFELFHSISVDGYHLRQMEKNIAKKPYLTF